jgi:hypothetical protein
MNACSFLHLSNDDLFFCLFVFFLSPLLSLKIFKIYSLEVALEEKSSEVRRLLKEAKDRAASATTSATPGNGSSNSSSNTTTAEGSDDVVMGLPVGERGSALLEKAFKIRGDEAKRVLAIKPMQSQDVSVVKRRRKRRRRIKNGGEALLLFSFSICFIYMYYNLLPLCLYYHIHIYILVGRFVERCDDQYERSGHHCHFKSAKRCCHKNPQKVYRFKESD